MRINHRRTDILVAKQFLDGSDVVSFFKEVRGKRMAECVTARGPVHARFANRLFNRTLQKAFVEIDAAPEGSQLDRVRRNPVE